MISFNTKYKKFRFYPEFGCVSGSFTLNNTEIKETFTIDQRCASLLKSKYPI